MVRIVLRNNASLRRRWVDSDVARLLGEKIVKGLNEREKIIVNYVIVHGSINVSQAQRLTEHNWPTSKKLLDKLVFKKVLTYVHTDNK